MKIANVRLLLIEDDFSLGASTEQLLEMYGFDVVWVSTQATALDQLAHGGFEAALLDLNLGEDSGVAIALAARLAGMELPPIIIVSAEPDHVICAAAKAIGAVASLRKPCGGLRLKAALQTALA